MIQVPINTSVQDLVYLQNAVTLILRDDPRLAAVPVVPEIKFLMDSDQSLDALWMLPAGAFTVTPTGVTINANAAPGPVGAGILVEMPGATSESRGVTGPPLVWEIGVVAMEERNTNFLSGTGTGITSEQLAQIVMDILHLQAVFGFGTLRVRSSCFTPAHDWMQLKPGIVAYRASFEAEVGRKQTGRSASVSGSFVGDTLTLTCSDSAATIYYTTDGSMPCSSNVNTGNPAGIGASIYTQPFAVTSGMVVLFASRKAGTLLSGVYQATAP